MNTFFKDLKYVLLGDKYANEEVQTFRHDKIYGILWFNYHKD